MSSQTQGTTQSRKRFSDEDVKTINSSLNEQRQFKDFVIASKAYSTAEKDAIRLGIDDFPAFWAQANSSKNDFDGSHKKGVGLWAKSYQDSAVVVSGFMENFSPILKMVEDFAAPYGGMAVGIISVLFTVAKNKNEIEERLRSTLSSIKDRLPGLKVYQRIYNDDDELDTQLQTRIVAAYQSFIDFSIAATKYYKNGGPRRWLRALGSSTSFQDKANKVRDNIVEIRRLCEELLNKNLDKVKQINIDQTKKIQNLETLLEEMEKQNDNNRVREIQRLLNLEAFSVDTQRKELEEYSQALASHDQLNASFFQQMQGEELELFRRQPVYQRWIKSPQQCLLILSGKNNESISEIDECWMSPVATAMIKDLGQECRRSIYAYSILPQPGKLVYDVLPAILLQLLRQKISALRDEKQYAELRSELQKLPDCVKLSKSDKTYEDKMLATLHKVALRVINFFDESDSLYIIVDRVDRCRDWKKVDHRKMLLECLVKLVEGARCKLRVLAVINGYSWPVEKYPDIGRNVKDRVITHAVEQGVIT